MGLSLGLLLLLVWLNDNPLFGGQVPTNPVGALLVGTLAAYSRIDARDGRSAAVNISAVIPNLNSGSCSTAVSTPLSAEAMIDEVLVVDAGSTDGSAERAADADACARDLGARDEHSGAAQPESRGSTQRVRAAAQQRRVRRPSDTREAGRGTRTATRVGASGARLRFEDGSPQNSADRYKTLVRHFSLRFPGGRLLPGRGRAQTQSPRGSSRSRGCPSAARSSAAPHGARSAVGTSGSRSSTRTRTSAGVLPRPAGAWRSGGTRERSTLAAARQPTGVARALGLVRALPREPVPLSQEVVSATPGVSTRSSGWDAPGCMSCSGVRRALRSRLQAPTATVPAAPARGRRCFGARRGHEPRAPATHSCGVRRPDATGCSFMAPGSRVTTTSVTHGCCHGFGGSTHASWSAPTAGWSADSRSGL